MEFIVFLVLAIGAEIVSEVLGERATGRRAAAAAAGDPVRVPVRVRGSAPFSSRYQRGRLELTPDSIRWTPRRGESFDLTTLGIAADGLDIHEDSSWRNWLEPNQLFPYTTIRCHDASGRVLFVRARGSDTATVVRRLHQEARPTSTRASGPVSRETVPPRPRRWPWIALALGLAVMLAPTYLVLAGESVSATVVSEVGSDSLLISFEDPWDRTPQTATIDRSTLAVGDELEVLATPWPMRGDAGPSWQLFAFGALVAVPLALAAFAGLWMGWQERRADDDQPPPSGPAPSTLPAAPVSGDATFDRVRHYLELRAAKEGWAPTYAGVGPPAPSSPWAALGTWSLVRIVAGIAVVPLVLMGIGLVLALPATLDALALAGAPTSTTSGRITSVDSGLPLAPAAQIEFDVDGTRVTADASVTAGLDVGAAVTVRYSVADPAHVIVVGHDGTVRDIALGWLLTLGAALFLVWRLGAALLPYRTMARLVDRPAEPMRYARTRSPDLDDVLLLFDPTGVEPPRFAVPLLPAAVDQVPLSGTCLVHGDVTDGGRVLPVVGGVRLWPSGDAFSVGDIELAVFLDPLLGVLDEEP